jgi:hypothetical protein
VIRIALLLAVALVGLEAALRFADFSAPLWYRPDPLLGWTLRPHVQGPYTREGHGEVRANRAGFRDSERLVDKPDGVYRIAVLGDSYTEALQVDARHAYWRLLPERLQRCGFGGGKDIETLAFAATGYGTGQQALLLESVAMRYQPDLVLLQFSPADDVQNNSLFLAEEKGRPFFLLDPKGNLRLDDSFAEKPGFVRHASLLRELGRKVADRSRSMQFALEAHARPFFREAQAGLDYQPDGLVPPRNESWEDALRITEALLVRMHHYSARNGARFAAFTAPHPVQLGERDLLYPDERLAAFAKRRGIAFHSLAAPMKQEAAQKSLYFQRHWNEEGHAAAAGVLAERLCAQR